MVPGKSCPIICRTGYVWHPIGMSRGLAPSSRAAAARNPVAAVFWRNCRLESKLIALPVSFPQDVHVVRHVSRYDVGKRAHRKRIIAGDPPALPCVIGQIAE